ncbi:hypothetical protein MGN01_46170 [Methylobacterium gnaphalii]|uniref:Uncharacterized protein n=1 Tax=Methylobacterium gnaphalii TaxID=1010610 RepID=A0A512JS84_9HYPH|nr:hypothetical protein MGN01_46170 [Methylobacterium gnaphalii]GLS48438.1 hypothetical protein GCM10007885_12820 [Methylobacterium gnaphalii]
MAYIAIGSNRYVPGSVSLKLNTARLHPDSGGRDGSWLRVGQAGWGAMIVHLGESL